jgi:hypothetical protein
VGGPIDEVRVTLALYSEDLEPDEVTRALGVQPTSAHRRGERRGPRSPPYRQGAWFLTEQSREREGAEPAIERLLKQVPNDAALWLLLGGKHDVQIRLGLHMSSWNEGFVIARELVARIAVLGATLNFDIYADGNEP